MPLSKARMRERKRQDRLVKPVVKPDSPSVVKPDAPQLKSEPFNAEVNTRLPLYNRYQHKPGDKVLMRGPTGKLVVIEVPELDEDGNPISGY